MPDRLFVTPSLIIDPDGDVLDPIAAYERITAERKPGQNLDDHTAVVATEDAARAVMALLGMTPEECEDRLDFGRGRGVTNPGLYFGRTGEVLTDS